MHHRNSPHTAGFSRYSATPHVCRCDSSATSLSTKCTNALVSLTCRHVFVGFVCVFVLAFLRPDRPRGAWKPEKNHIALLTRSAKKIIISASRKLAFRIGQNSPTPQVFDALNTLAHLGPAVAGFRSAGSEKIANGLERRVAVGCEGSERQCRARYERE